MDYAEFMKNAENFIFAEGKPEKADIIFVPGNGFPEMAENAAKLYKQGYASYILPSGRYSVTVGKFAGVQTKKELYDGDYETEWEFLKSVLMKNGVPKEAILREDQSTFTYENAIFSKLLTDRLGIFPKTAILCCKSFHARRSLLYYQLLYPDTHFLVCPVTVQNITRDNWTQTPEAIDVVLGEVERCGTQFHQILREYRKG